MEPEEREKEDEDRVRDMQRVKKKKKEKAGGREWKEKALEDKERQTERGWEVGEELFPRGITLGVSLHWSF